MDESCGHLVFVPLSDHKIHTHTTFFLSIPTSTYIGDILPTQCEWTLRRDVPTDSAITIGLPLGH